MARLGRVTVVLLRPSPFSRCPRKPGSTWRKSLPLGLKTNSCPIPVGVPPTANVVTLDVAGSSPLLLDLAYHPGTGQLLVIDFGNQQVLAVNPVTGASAVFIPTGTMAGPNVLTFDSAGNVYVSERRTDSCFPPALSAGETLST